MAPPGRRRAGGRRHFHPILLLSTLLLLLPSAFAASAVLGIDLGTEYIKAALVKPGIPIEIVLTKDSKRKEASSIAFKGTSQGSSSDEIVQLPERLYGSDSLALAPRLPADVYSNLKHLLGVSGSVKDTAVKEYTSRYPALMLKPDTGNGTLGFTSASFDTESPPFTVEELLGMQLKSIKENGEAMAGSGYTIRDAVFSIPPFYTADERRAIKLAANLAGLKTMALVSDGMAVGLNYATSRTFPNVTDGKKPEYHMVYDMGAGSTTATILRFQGRTVKDVGRRNKTVQEVSVVGLGWDRRLGGDALNDLIVNDMIEKFIDTSGAKSKALEAIAVKSNGRTMAKLWREAEKVRHVLSANSDTSANFEGLQEDIDFRYKLSRTNFEALAVDYRERVGKPLNDALQNAALTVDDLDSIILYGGAVRTPFVQSALEASAGDPGKTKGNVNADEAAVFGAAFKAASLSPSFRVKEIKADDTTGYPAILEWSTKEKTHKQRIFTPTSSIGAIKQLPFKYLTDFAFSIRQQLVESESSQPIEKDYLNVEVTNVTASVADLVKSHGCDRAAINTTISVRLDPTDCLPEVVRGTVSCEVEIVEKKGVFEDVKGLFGFGSKKQEPLAADKNSTSTSATSKGESATSVSEGSASSTSSNAAEKSKDAKPKKKTEIRNLNVKVAETGQLQPSATDLARIKGRLLAFDKSDEGRRLRDEQFNILESFTYRTRDLLSDDAIFGISTAEQRQAIEDELKSTGDWLYTDGAKATYETVKEKYEDLKGMVDPIKKRKEEFAKRPKAIEKVREALNQTNTLMRIVRREIEKAASSAAAAAASLSTSPSTADTEPESSSTETPDAKPDSDEPLDADTLLSEDKTSSEGTNEDMTIDTESSSATMTPSSSSTTSTSTKPVTTVDPSLYTEEDFTLLSGSYESVQTWLEKQLEAQDKLAASEDPVLLSAELETRAKFLNTMATDLLRRRNKLGDKSKSSTKSKTSKTTSKSSKTANKSKSKATEATASSASESSLPDIELEVTSVQDSEDVSASESASASASAPTHDEL